MSCAGLGRRLGVGTTKALVSVLGRPLIAWQLDLLREVRDLRIVVGYQAEDVMRTVLAIRRDVLFVFNRDYATTGTAQSLALGARAAGDEIVSLDGDLLVHPDDWDRFVALPAPVLGTLPVNSDEPVYVRVEGDTVRSFSRESGDLEWSGLVKFSRNAFASREPRDTAPHVYQFLNPMLPMRAMPIRATEIDTPQDYLRAVDWLRLHGDRFQR
jgi:choline kinase